VEKEQITLEEYIMAEFEKEVSVLVQRVVRDISNAFKKNPNM